MRISSPRIPRQVGRVQISRSCDFFKARYPAPWHFYDFIFFPKTLYLQVCKFEKKILQVGKQFFSEYHRLEYRDRYVKVVIFFCERDIQPRVISAKVPKNVCLASRARSKSRRQYPIARFSSSSRRTGRLRSTQPVPIDVLLSILL